VAIQASGNPWIIDGTNSGNAITTMNIHPKVVRWVGGTTAGHTAVVKDQNGNEKYTFVATGGNYSESLPGMPMNGLIVSTLASGKLYLYF
jgi:hypothetical protein